MKPEVNLPRGTSSAFQAALKTDSFEKPIQGTTVKIILGDITKVKCDAYVVPQFTSAASYGGVGGAVARSGGLKGLEAYDKFVQQKGEQPFGKILLTPSGGGNSKSLLHVVSVGSGEDNEFNTIQTAFYNVLKLAQEQGIQSIAAPALGTGMIGRLTDKQSANAMLSAIHQFAKEGGNLDVSIVIYGSKPAHVDFIETLELGQFEAAKDESGKKDINLADWVEGMSRDAKANRKFRTEQN